MSIEYVLKDADGATLDEAGHDSPLVYLHGHNNIVSGLEKTLEGKQKGDEVSVVVSPEEAYGMDDPSRIITLPRSQFTGVEEIEPGGTFEAETQEGTTLLKVLAVKGENIVVDSNHPLAGKELHFEVKVSDVRDASEEELAQGHVHDSADGNVKVRGKQDESVAFKEKVHVVIGCLVVLFVLISVYGMIFGDSSSVPGYVESEVTYLAQRDYGLFRDQYKISVPFNNSRGTIAVLELTDGKFESGTSVIYILTKSQSSEKSYQLSYKHNMAEEMPTKEVIQGLASYMGFID